MHLVCFHFIGISGVHEIKWMLYCATVLTMYLWCTWKLVLKTGWHENPSYGRDSSPVWWFLAFVLFCWLYGIRKVCLSVGTEKTSSGGIALTGRELQRKLGCDFPLQILSHWHLASNRRSETSLLQFSNFKQAFALTHFSPAELWNYAP